MKLFTLPAAALLALSAAMPARADTPQFTITDLGTVGGASYSQGMRISGDGDTVVGRSLGNTGVAFSWTQASGMVALPGLAGQNYAVATAVNNAGVVVGTSSATFGGAGALPVMWKNGVVTQFSMPAGQTAGRVNDVNNSGIAVGSVGSSNTEYAAIFNTATGTSTRITALSSQGSFMQAAFAINDAGIVVGAGVNTAQRNVILSYDSVTNVMTEIAPLPYSGANASIAYAINDNGSIGGSSGNGSQAFIWSPNGGMKSVPLPAGSTTTGSIRGLNDQGWAVGNSGGRYSNPFLFADNTTYLLSSLIVNKQGWNFDTTTSASAMAISDNGAIVGTARYNGFEHAYLLTPVPEPATYALMLGGILVLGAIKRRRC